MLRKIKLYGRLAKFIGCRTLEADVATAAEAVRFLLANWPGLEAHMAEQHYRVSAGDYDLDKDELHFPIGERDIDIVPVVAGAGAVGRIIAGALLITAAVLAAAGTFGASLAVGGSLYFATAAVGYIGAALLFGGISELLLKQKDNEDPRESFSFSGIQNTSRIGTPVPIVYGEIVVGSVVISAGIDTDRLASGIYLNDVTIGPYTYKGINNLIEPVSGNLQGGGGSGLLSYSTPSGAGLYGTLSVSPNGSYVYTFNNTALNSLAVGSYEDVLTIRATDGDSTVTATFKVLINKTIGYRLAISIIDEDSNYPSSTRQSNWTAWASQAGPEDLFLVLKPVPPGVLGATVTLPFGFNGQVYEVTRPGDGGVNTSYQTILLGIFANGVSSAKIWVDNSGSMNRTTVAADLNAFESYLTSQGIPWSEVAGTTENWIAPHIT